MRHTPIDGAGLKIRKLLFIKTSRLLLLDPWQFVHPSFLKPGGRQVFYSLYFGNFVHAHNTFSFLIFNHHVEYYTHLNRNYCAISKRKCATDINMQVADMCSDDFAVRDISDEGFSREPRPLLTPRPRLKTKVSCFSCREIKDVKRHKQR